MSFGSNIRAHVKESTELAQKAPRTGYRRSIASPSKNPVMRHLDEAFDLAIECEPHPRKLRVSSLPYCPILDVFNPREKGLADLSGLLYTSIGHAVHSGVQTYMPLSPTFGRTVWGSWKCPSCKTIYKSQFRPATFCCRVPYEYIEVEFEYGPLSGHLDMLVRYGKHWIAYEFKTVGRPPSKPKPGYLLQIRTYVELLQIQYGIKVHSYVVVYVGREHFKRTVFGPYTNTKSSQKTLAWIHRAIKGYKAATRVASVPSWRNAREMVKYRPCKCDASYSEYMARNFELSKGCPLLSRCKKGDEAAAKVVMEIVGHDGTENSEVPKGHAAAPRRGAQGARDREQHVRDRQAERNPRRASKHGNLSSRMEDNHAHKRERQARPSARRPRDDAKRLPRKIF